MEKRRGEQKSQKKLLAFCNDESDSNYYYRFAVVTFAFAHDTHEASDLGRPPQKPSHIIFVGFLLFCVWSWVCVCVCGFQCLPICRMWISQMPEIVPIWKIMLFLCASAHGPNVDKSGCVCDTFYFQFQTLMRTTFQQLPSCYSPTPTRRMTNTDSWNSVRRCAERIHPRWPTLLPTHSVRHNRQSTVALHDYWLHFHTKFPVDFEHTRSNWPYCTKFIIAATATATSKSSSTTTKMQSFRSKRKSQNRHGNS